jgi:hypothetical protein
VPPATRVERVLSLESIAQASAHFVLFLPANGVHGRRRGQDGDLVVLISLALDLQVLLKLFPYFVVLDGGE